VPRKKEKNMKGICAVLGLALLMGCNNNSDCPRKDKSCGGCGKRVTTAEAPVDQKEAHQEIVSVYLESETPSK
jgi:hypothetical protein